MLLAEKWESQNHFQGDDGHRLPAWGETSNCLFLSYTSLSIDANVGREHIPQICSQSILLIHAQLNHLYPWNYVYDVAYQALPFSATNVEKLEVN